MRSVRAFALAAPIVLTMACGSSAGSDEPSERIAQTESALESTATLTSALTQSTRVAYHFLDEAAAGVRNVRTAACAKMTTRLVPHGVTVSASFEEGCEIPVLGSVSGSLAMTFVVTRGVITFDVSYASFTLAGVTLTGSTRIEARAPQTTVTMDLTSVVDARRSHVVLDGTIVRDRAALGATVDASGSVQSGQSSAIPFTVGALHVALGTCYADRGTATIDPFTVSFLPSTPRDGTVSLSAFGITSAATLPPYGRCPR